MNTKRNAAIMILLFGLASAEADVSIGSGVITAGNEINALDAGTDIQALLEGAAGAIPPRKS